MALMHWPICPQPILKPPKWPQPATKSTNPQLSRKKHIATEKNPESESSFTSTEQRSSDVLNATNAALQKFLELIENHGTINADLTESIPIRGYNLRIY